MEMFSTVVGPLHSSVASVTAGSEVKADATSSPDNTVRRACTPEEYQHFCAAQFKASKGAEADAVVLGPKAIPPESGAENNDGELLYMLTHALATNCFLAWLAGHRLAPTLKSHCVEYMTPNRNSEEAEASFAQLFHEDADCIKNVSVIMKACLLIHRSQFQQYTEQQCEAILKDWQNMQKAPE